MSHYPPNQYGGDNYGQQGQGYYPPQQGYGGPPPQGYYPPEVSMTQNAALEFSNILDSMTLPYSHIYLAK